MSEKRRRSKDQILDASGVDYELLVQSLFDQMVNQGQVETIEVRHNVILQGLTACHQIDVYWKFRRGGVEYQTIVQAKDWNRKVNQGEVLKLRGVLQDLPGQPRGIIVSRHGLQKGAAGAARKAGILAYQLFEEPQRPIELPVGCIFKFKPTLVAADSKTGSVAISLVGTVFEAQVSNLSVRLQKAAYPAHRADNLVSQFAKRRLAEFVFEDAEGHVITDLQERVGAVLKKLADEDRLEAPLELEFAAPTFLTVATTEAQRLRVTAITGIVTRKDTPFSMPMRTSGFVPFILRNLTEGSESKLHVSKKDI